MSIDPKLLSDVLEICHDPLFRKWAINGEGNTAEIRAELAYRWGKMEAACASGDDGKRFTELKALKELCKTNPLDEKGKRRWTDKHEKDYWNLDRRFFQTESPYAKACRAAYAAAYALLDYAAPALPYEHWEPLESLSSEVEWFHRVMSIPKFWQVECVLTDT